MKVKTNLAGRGRNLAGSMVFSRWCSFITLRIDERGYTPGLDGVEVDWYGLDMEKLLAGKIALIAATLRDGRGIAVQLGAVGATVYVTGRTSGSNRSQMNRLETILRLGMASLNRAACRPRCRSPKRARLPVPPRFELPMREPRRAQDGLPEPRSLMAAALITRAAGRLLGNLELGAQFVTLQDGK